MNGTKHSTVTETRAHTLTQQHWIGRVGFSRNKSVSEVLSLGHDEEDLVKQHKAVEIFGCMFSRGFDVLKLYLHRLPAKAANVSGLHFGKKTCLLWRNTGRKK